MSAHDFDPRAGDDAAYARTQDEANGEPCASCAQAWADNERLGTRVEELEATVAKLRDYRARLTRFYLTAIGWLASARRLCEAVDALQAEFARGDVYGANDAAGKVFAARAALPGAPAPQSSDARVDPHGDAAESAGGERASKENG